MHSFVMPLSLSMKYVWLIVGSQADAFVPHLHFHICIDFRGFAAASLPCLWF